MSAAHRAFVSAFAALAVSVSAWAASPAFAQNIIGNPGQFQVVRPQHRPRTTVGGNAVQGVIQSPRFIVEAVNFHAVDESGPNSPGSDEVFAIFRSPQSSVATGVYGGVDTGDIVQWRSGQSCIWPVVDPDNRGNHRWACDTRGGAGPVRFSIELYEVDPDYTSIFTGAFCIDQSASDISPPRNETCDVRQSDVLFRADFTYETSQILARLQPNCRCLEETARYRETDWRGDLEYQVTFRITRVDTAQPQPGVGTFDTDPVVYRSGRLSVITGRGLDFDAGAMVQTGGDFGFAGSNGNYTILPRGGAKIWPGNASARGYATCYGQRNSASYVTTTSVLPSAGSYACFVTDEGRVGELRIVSITPLSFGSGATIVVDYTTWQ